MMTFIGDLLQTWPVVSRHVSTILDHCLTSLGSSILCWTPVIQTPESRLGAMRFGVLKAASPSSTRLLASAYVSSHPWLRRMQATPTANWWSTLDIRLRFWCFGYWLRCVFVIQYLRRRPLVKLWGWIDAQVHSAHFWSNYILMSTHRISLSQSQRSPEEIRQLEEALASIRLRTRHLDPYEEWEQRTRKEAFVSRWVMNFIPWPHYFGKN